VASYQCADGSVPLRGDPHAGAQARVGNVGGPHAGVTSTTLENSHIVDKYVVPCPGVPVTLFVCMYHCEGE
jgi:hypothetical protein